LFVARSEDVHRGEFTVQRDTRIDAPSLLEHGRVKFAEIDRERQIAVAVEAH
jgi:hypothetical protein